MHCKFHTGFHSLIVAHKTKCKIDTRMSSSEMIMCYSSQQMTLSAFNPFTWDATSASVKSHVLSLVLKDQDGKLLKVENSEKEVELKIKRDARPEPKDAKESFFAKPSKNGKMKYHKIDLPHATGNALRLRVSWVKTSAWLLLFRRPSSFRSCGLFLESPENFSGPKSQLSNRYPLVLNS